MTGVVAGVVVTLWMTFSPGWTGGAAALKSPFHNFLIIVFGTATILLPCALWDSRFEMGPSHEMLLLSSPGIAANSPRTACSRIAGHRLV